MQAVLISSEAFTGDPFLAYVNREQALDRLHRAFPDARVLLGVRGQRTLLWSLYKHQLRFGGARPLQEMLDEAGHWGPGWLDPESFLYTPFVASLAERFGSPPHLLVYEHLQHDRDRYLGDLLAFLGAELEGAVSAGRMNEAAVGDREVRARRALNRLALNRGRSQGVLPLPRSIQAGVVRTAGRLARGAPDQLVLDALADRYRPDNLLLDERYGLRLGEHPAVAASWYLDAPT
ncbi:MAG: hypothetical protein R2711_12925 [Acidimicrobiales bacterium]